MDKNKQYANEYLRRLLYKHGIHEVLEELGLTDGEAAIVDHIVRTIKVLPIDNARTPDDIAANIVEEIYLNGQRLDDGRDLPQKIQYIKAVISTQLRRKLYTQDKRRYKHEMTLSPEIEEQITTIYKPMKEIARKKLLQFIANEFEIYTQSTAIKTAIAVSKKICQQKLTPLLANTEF